MRSAEQCGARTTRWTRFLHVGLSAAVVAGFCCVIVARGHGIGPLGLLSCHGDLRSCLTWGCAFALLGSHGLTNLSIALTLRFISLASLAVIWLVWNLELGMFADADGLAIVCITSAPFFAALVGELVMDRLASRTPRSRTITIRDMLVLTLVAVGFVLPKALFK